MKISNLPVIILTFLLTASYLQEEIIRNPYTGYTLNELDDGWIMFWART